MRCYDNVGSSGLKLQDPISSSNDTKSRSGSQHWVYLKRPESRTVESDVELEEEELDLNPQIRLVFECEAAHVEEASVASRRCL